MKIIRRILVGLLVLIGLLGLGFIWWGSTPAQAMPEAINSLKSDDQVLVEVGNWLVFTPHNQKPTTGYIFYPGGRVDYRAYAPYARAIAAKGYLVIIPHMPLNLAVFGIDSAEKVMKTYPVIQHWVIGGHSLGGSMAADYLVKNQSKIDGLVFLASYPATSDNLSTYEGKVASISGSLDGLATPAKIEASRALLPVSTTWITIQGGDHAYFGWYGAQQGDNPAAITREEQQSMVIQSTLKLLDQVNQ